MAEINLSKDEAKVLLRGMVDPNSPTYKLGIKTSPYYKIEVHSLGYRREQEVGRHFTSFDLTNFVDEEELQLDHQSLIEFLDNPMESDISPEEARDDLEELLGHADLYFNDRVNVTEDADSNIRTAKNQEVEV
jgi:hypothetical protein